MVSLVLWGVAATAVLSALVAILAWRQHPHPGARPFAIGMAGIVWWLTVMFLGHGFTDGRLFALSERLEGIGAAVMAIAWFVFALEYTGRGEYVTRRVVVLLSVFPVVSLPLALGASQYLELYAGWFGYQVSLPPFDVWGWWQPIGFVYLYVLLGAGFVLILGLVMSRRLPRPELASLWLLAIAVPLAIGTLHISGVFSPLGGEAPTPFGLALTGVIGLLAISRYDVFQSAPLARNYVVDRLEAGMIVFDDECRITDYNEWAADILELPDDALGTDVRSVLADRTTLGMSADRDDAPGAFVDAIGGAELELVDGGDVTHLRAEVSPLERPYGVPHGYSLLLYDTTVQRAYQAQLKRQNDYLDRLTDVVAHDLRTPLDTSLARARRLQKTLERDEMDSTDLRSQIASIQDSLDRSATLVDDMLAMTRGGQQVTEPETLDVVDIAELAWSYVDAGDIALETDGSAPTRGDRQRLVQLFENLYRNALVHADGATVVRVGTVEDGVYLEDDGPGIAPERRDDVFEPGDSTEIDGTGLGLSIVREVARAHGWEVSVTAGRDGGARFELTGMDFE